MNEQVVTALGLTRYFGAQRVLGPLDLDLRAGDRLALTGPNGSGKSTLLRCVAGTLAPSAGAITVCGHAAGSLSARALIGVSYSQERSFYLRLTGRQNLMTFARLRAPLSDARDAVAETIAELQIETIAARRVDACSTGMVQQLALARALLGRPALLLLDEPTRSLDEAAIERLWNAVEHRPQMALMISTHRHEDVERCERRLDLAA